MIRTSPKLPNKVLRIVPQMNDVSTLGGEKASVNGVHLCTCTTCGARYFENNYTKFDPDQNEVCPGRPICLGCVHVQNKTFNGTILLEGLTSPQNHDEIVELVRCISHESWLVNPEWQILDWKTETERIQLKTTNAGLAIRIGKAVQRVFEGKLRITKTIDGTYADVFWKCP